MSTSNERDRVVIGRDGHRIYLQHTASGNRVELTPRMALAVVAALRELVDEIQGRT